MLNSLIGFSQNDLFYFCLDSYELRYNVVFSQEWNRGVASANNESSRWLLYDIYLFSLLNGSVRELKVGRTNENMPVCCPGRDKTKI